MKILGCLFVIIVMFVVFYCTFNKLKYTQKHNVYANIDALRGEVYFRVNKSKDEIIECLKVRSVYDLLKYNFDDEKGIINFPLDMPDGTVPMNYYVELIENKSGTIIKLTNQNGLFCQSRVPLFLN